MKKFSLIIKLFTYIMYVLISVGGSAKGPVALIFLFFLFVSLYLYMI